jgi:ParB family chromosome partitioning protein
MENLHKGLRDLMDENINEKEDGEEVLNISLDEIKPNPYQPRYVFSDAQIDELAQSIKEHGIISPIIVKKMNDYYAIIAGERRFRACQKLGLKTIPAIVRQYEKNKMIEIALIENLQRENLSPIEEARAIDLLIKELDITQKEASEKIGKTRSYVTNMIGLLNLPKVVLDFVDEKKLSMGHARALSKMQNDERIIELAKLIIKKNLSVRQTEALVQNESKNKKIKKDKPLEYKEKENLLNKKYNARFYISDNRLMIKANTKEEMQKLLEKLER